MIERFQAVRDVITQLCAANRHFVSSTVIRKHPSYQSMNYKNSVTSHTSVPIMSQLL